jgi:hypothetical protein
MRNHEFTTKQSLHETAWMLSVAAMALVLSMSAAFSTLF